MRTGGCNRNSLHKSHGNNWLLCKLNREVVTGAKYMLAQRTGRYTCIRASWIELTPAARCRVANVSLIHERKSLGSRLVPVYMHHETRASMVPRDIYNVSQVHVE